jgi:hypothetical protein
MVILYNAENLECPCGIILLAKPLAGMSTNLKEHIKNETYAKWAYELSDALIAEREKK